MNSKVLKVFYGADNLPYQDKERVVHFPVLGNAFMGASNTTEIWFYFEKIGEPNNTWVAIAKLPNGKRGAVKLNTFNDSELNEPYAKLQLNTWFTQLRGDVYISLNGYDGGITLSLDQETGLYSVTGTPVIQATGSVKLTIQYATQLIGGDEVDEITLEAIYAKFGEKLDTNKGIVVIANPQVDISEYDNGQYFYSKSDNSIYENVSGVPTPRFTAYSKSESDTLLATKVDKTTDANIVYGTNNSGEQYKVPYSSDFSGKGNNLVQRDSNAQINVPTTPTNNNHATSKVYVDTSLTTLGATKVDKTTSGYKIYATDESGNQTTLPYDEDTEGKVVRRDENGHIYVQNPTANGQATPKQYVDVFAKSLVATIDNSTYVMTLTLKDKGGNTLSTQTIDLPLETMVVGGSYDDDTESIILTLKNGQTITIPVSDLVSGLVSTSDLNTALSDYVTLATQQNITGEKTFVGDLKFKGSGTTTVGQITTTNYAVNIGYGGVNHITIGGNNLYTNVADYDLGSNSKKWRDLYLGGELKDGTNSISVANIQEKLVSGTNIKSINNTSLLGSGNIDYDNALSDSSTNAVQNKVLKGYLDDIGNRLAVLEESIIADDSLNYTYLSDSAIPTNANTYPIIESAGMDNTNIKGNSFVYNQLVTTGVSTTTVNGITFTNNNNGTWTLSGLASANANLLITNINKDKVSNHKILWGVYSNALTGIYATEGYTGITASAYNISTLGALSNNFNFYIVVGSGTDLSTPKTITPLFIDLTQMFPTDTPTSVDDPRVQWAIQYALANPSYNAGSLLNSKPTALISNGFNIWDEEWENGDINQTTGLPTGTSTNYIRCKNYIQVVPNATYYYYCGYGSISSRVYLYDYNKNFISESYRSFNSSIAIPSNCYYIKFRFGTGNYSGTTYDNDICINISNASLNGQYRPYKAPISYPLSLPILRSAGSVQDDVSKVNVGVVDLGTLNWTYEDGVRFFADLSTAKASTTNAICPLYKINPTYVVNNMDMYISPSKTLSIKNNSYTDATTFKSAMSGVLLYYELATPTDQPAITLPENIEFEKGGSLEVTYDSTAPTPSDFDFEVAVYKPIE